VSDPLLSLERVSAVRGEILALHDVSLRLDVGERVAVLGPNGAGKSTLLRTITGLTHPCAGTITYGGRRIDGLPAHKVAKLGISLVPEGRGLFPDLTVTQNLRLGGYGESGLVVNSELKKRIEQIQRRFPLLATLHTQPARVLSGGEGQLLAIARALVSRPRLLLLDEPSVGLAPAIVASVMEALRSVAEEGVAILLVEQNVRLATAICDRFYVLSGGQVVFEGDRDHLQDQDILRSYFGRGAQIPAIVDGSSK
jgi:branched-chain amino acid transport system ATP-binding protein